MIELRWRKWKPDESPDNAMQDYKQAWKVLQYRQTIPAKAGDPLSDWQDVPTVDEDPQPPSQ